MCGCIVLLTAPAVLVSEVLWSCVQSAVVLDCSVVLLCGLFCGSTHVLSFPLEMAEKRSAERSHIYVFLRVLSPFV